MISKKLSKRKSKSKKITKKVSLKRKTNPELSKSEVEDWMFSYMSKHSNWKPQQVAMATIRHFKIKVESPYKNWVFDIANKWANEEKRIRSTLPSRGEIKNWMINYIARHPEFQGSHNDIMSLATKASKNFKFSSGVVDLYDLANEADSEYYKATVKYT